MLCTGERWVRTSRRRLEQWPHNKTFRFGAPESILKDGYFALH
jgi:hypothetical protein